jgi:hypothetical protein
MKLSRSAGSLTNGNLANRWVDENKIEGIARDYSYAGPRPGE